MTPVRALLIDLDDTLYPQSQFLEGAWDAVAEAAVRFGAPREALAATLRAMAALGTAEGRIIDRSLIACGHGHVDAALLVGAFTQYRPTSLEPYEQVATTLHSLRQHHTLALVTDGIPAQQRAKLAALGLVDYFDIVVCSDDAGREFRKPHERPFVTALHHLGVAPIHAVMIGDSPHKDVAGAHAVGMRSIRVRTGEYASISDTATVSIDRFCEVVEALNRISGEAP